MVNILDIEAPSPRNMISEDTAKERSSNRCNSPHGSDKTKSCWAFGKGD